MLHSNNIERNFRLKVTVKGAATFNCAFEMKRMPQAFDISCCASFTPDQSLMRLTPPSDPVCGDYVIVIPLASCNTENEFEQF